MDFQKLFELTDEMKEMQRVQKAMEQHALQLQTSTPRRSFGEELLEEPLREVKKTRKAAERTAEEVEKHTAQHDVVIEELRTQTKEARESADKANRLSRIAIAIAIGSFAAACIAVLLR